MKKIILLILAVILSAGSGPSDLFADVSRLSDNEMDGVYARGFELNIEGAIEYQLSALGNAIVADLAGNLQGPAMTASINITNGVAVSQMNMAHITSLNGSIDGATVNNTNTAHISSDTPSEVNQSNIAAILAPNGNISNSVINCVNSVEFDTMAAVGTVNQNSVSVFVAQGFADNTITHTNTVTAGGNAIVSSSSTQTLTFQGNGLTAMVYIDSVTIQ